MDERIFLGVDGGGTKCAARLVDGSGAALGEGVSGPANVFLGLDNAFAAMEEAALNAVGNAGLDMPLSELIAGAGLAGIISPGDLEAAQAHRHPFASLAIQEDAFIACLGAHGGKDGGIVITGTGSNALAFHQGEIITFGGWGFTLGDQGSGARLGYAAVRLAVLEHDGFAPPSAIGSDILNRFSGTPENMTKWAMTALPKDFAVFAPAVFEHAGNGDGAAIKLASDFGQDVSQLIKALTDRGVRQVALIGGLTDQALQWIGKTQAEYLCEPKSDPLSGAILLAQREP